MIRIALTLAALILITSNAQAALFCVGTSAELASALNTARNNGQSDLIKLQVGDYPVPGQAFSVFMLENHALTLSGGWDGPNHAPCAEQSGLPHDTVLDGEGLNRVLNVVFNQGLAFSTDLEFINFTVLDGLSNGIDAAGLNVNCLNPCTARFLLDRMKFVANLGNDGAALRFNGGDKITMRNSVLAFNRTRTAGGVVDVTLPAASRGLYFVNNTVTDNWDDVVVPGSSSTAGLSVSLNETVSEFSQSFITNNLFWNNDHADLFTNALGVHYIHNNNYQQRIGLADHVSGNLSESPNLSPFLLNFAPLFPSPLIDAGRSMPAIIPFPPPFALHWDHGDFDYVGNPRVRHLSVDIGAVEAGDEPPIFADTFELNL